MSITIYTHSVTKPTGERDYLMADGVQRVGGILTFSKVCSDGQIRVIAEYAECGWASWRLYLDDCSENGLDVDRVVAEQLHKPDGPPEHKAGDKWPAPIEPLPGGKLPPLEPQTYFESDVPMIDGRGDPVMRPVDPVCWSGDDGDKAALMEAVDRMDGTVQPPKCPSEYF